MSEWLKEKYDVFLTQEPSNNEIGKLIRTLLKKTLPAAADALLFAADRVLHSEEIKKALNKGKYVVSDRYTESSVCYQGVDLEKKWVSNLNKFAIKPDLTIILDIDPEVGLKRKANSSEKFEKVDILKKVRNNFLNRSKKMGYQVIDTSKEIDEVQKEIRNCIKLILEK